MTMRQVQILLTATLLLCLSACGELRQTDEVAARLEALFDRLEKHQLFRGAALVSDGGQVVYSTARGLANEEWGIPNAVDTRYRILSLSKQFAAVIVLQLADEGRLSLDDPLAAHMSGLPEAWSDKVTVNHLLSQTTGIPDYTLLPDYLEVVSKRRFTRDTFFRLVCGDPLFSTLHFAPGEKWEYSNTNYFLLGVLAETVAGVSYEDLVEQRIFVPLEMHDSGVYDSLKAVPMMAEGYDLTYTDQVERAAHSEFSPKSVPSGGLYSTVRDLLKWSAALRDGRLLSPGMQEVFTTPTHVDGDVGYVCGQWREFRDISGSERVEIFSHGGSSMGMSTWLLRVPAEDRSVVLLHNGGSARESFLEQVALAALDILAGGQGELPPLDLIGPLGNTYFHHRESLFDHYRLLKQNHGEIYDFSPEQLSMMGRVLIERLGDRDTATAMFRLNVEEHPESPLAHRDLGSELLEAGSEDRALVHLLRVRELSPEPDAELEALIARAREGASPGGSPP
jgi:CubicO group peptidase (beta-lactamase class C family)